MRTKLLCTTSGLLLGFLLGLWWNPWAIQVHAGSYRVVRTHRFTGATEWSTLGTSTKWYPIAEAEPPPPPAPAVTFDNLPPGFILDTK